MGKAEVVRVTRQKEDLAPLGGLSTDEARLWSTLSLEVVKAWRLDEEQLADLFGAAPDEGASSEKWQDYDEAFAEFVKKLNSDDARIVMCLLWMREIGDQNELTATANKQPRHFSKSELAGDVASRPSKEATGKHLDRNVLPALLRAGYIRGCEKRPARTNERFEIEITRKGISAVENFLVELKRRVPNLTLANSIQPANIEIAERVLKERKHEPKSAESAEDRWLKVRAKIQSEYAKSRMRFWLRSLTLLPLPAEACPNTGVG
jgi:hypothetical protein